MGQKYHKYSKTCAWAICQQYILAEISARERESCQDTETFNKTLIPSYNDNIPIVHCLWQFIAYLAVPNPLGGQLVPGDAQIRQRKLDLVKEVKTN